MKILFLSYFFSGARNMGATRVRRLARFLSQSGHAVTVVSVQTPDPASEIRSIGCRLEAVRAPDPERLFAPRSRRSAESAGAGELRSKATGLTWFLNRWLCVPDKYVFWYGPALRAARRRVQEDRPDLIFASLEPRTDGLVAARLARETGIPMVLEYRDLWTGNPNFHLGMPTALHARWHAALERRALRSASAVTCVCEGIRGRLAARFSPNVPMAVHTNFFDPDEYPVETERPADAERFVIAYLGALYGRREPSAFLRGLAAFAQEREPRTVEFRWAGPIAGVPHLQAAMQEPGLSDAIRYLGRLPHREALGELRRADAALVLVAPHDDIHIPGKLYEALGARVPVLLVGGGAEARGIVAETRGGLAVCHDPNEIAVALRQLAESRKAGSPWPFREEAVARYSLARVGAGLEAFLERARRPAA